MIKRMIKRGRHTGYHPAHEPRRVPGSHPAARHAPRPDPQLTLSDPVDPNQDGYILSFRAELTAAGLIATTDVVVAQGHDDLDAFFDRLVASWRGWQGEQVWEALEHQLSIAASHDGIGHVRLRVTLRQDHLVDAWQASATFVVDAGEDLRGLASRIARFLAS
jgi:Family of unknown function (DUF6228)